MAALAKKFAEAFVEPFRLVQIGGDPGMGLAQALKVGTQRPIPHQDMHRFDPAVGLEPLAETQQDGRRTGASGLIADETDLGHRFRRTRQLWSRRNWMALRNSSAKRSISSGVEVKDRLARAVAARP
jgi:hypothetical protein